MDEVLCSDLEDRRMWKIARKCEIPIGLKLTTSDAKNVDEPISHGQPTSRGRKTTARLVTDAL